MVIKPEEKLVIIKKWIYKNGLSFNLKNFKAIHFSKNHNLLNSSIYFQINEKIEFVINSLFKSSILYQLGVYFDFRFLFIYYAKKIVVISYLVVIKIYILTKTTCRIEAKIIRQVINSYILLIIVYITLVWQLYKIQINKARNII